MEDARAAVAAYGVLSAIAAFTEAVQAADAADDQTLATQARLRAGRGALHHAGRAGEAQLVVREAVRGARRGNDPDAFGRRGRLCGDSLVPDDELRGGKPGLRRGRPSGSPTSVVTRRCALRSSGGDPLARPRPQGGRSGARLCR